MTSPNQEILCKICGQPSEKSVCRNCYFPFYEETPGRKSHAFETGEIDITQETNDTTLDLFYTDITEFNLVSSKLSFPELQILRLSHCHQLVDVQIVAAPKLQALDLSDCKSIQNLSIDYESSKNLRALDISGCKSLSTFNADLSKLEYLSAFQVPLPTLPAVPSIKYIDLNNSKIQDKQFIIQLSHISSLEKASLTCNAKIDDYSDFTLLPNLYYLICDYGSKFTAFQENPHPTSLIFVNIDRFPELNNAISHNWSNYAENHKEIIGSYHQAERLLYGPYPPPPGDRYLEPSQNPEESQKKIFEVPSSYDKQKAIQYIAGVMFGTGIGDCLGLHVERDPKEYTRLVCEGRPNIVWTHPWMTERGMFFHRGSFTDDTALMLMFVRSISEIVSNEGYVDEKNAGAKIKHWIDCGLDEHRDGMGIGQGRSTAAVVHHPSFDDDPIAASKAYYESINRYSAGNGGVMRTGAVGCFCFWDENIVIHNAIQFCLITHASNLCLYSSLVISLIIAREIQINSSTTKDMKKQNLDKTIKDSFKIMKDLKIEMSKNEIQLCTKFANAKTIEELELENGHVAPTLQTMGCGIWVLRKDFSYSEGIETIIKGGGDTDTNGAVAGACLGARWGFTSIPMDVINYFFYGSSINRETIKLAKLMGMNWCPPSYEEWPVQKSEKPEIDFEKKCMGSQNRLKYYY